MSCPDNYDKWEQHQAAQDRAEARLLECSECGNKIYEEFCNEISDEPVCDECMSNNHRKPVEYFM